MGRLLNVFGDRLRCDDIEKRDAFKQRAGALFKLELRFSLLGVARKDLFAVPHAHADQALPQLVAVWVSGRVGEWVSE